MFRLRKILEECLTQMPQDKFSDGYDPFPSTSEKCASPREPLTATAENKQTFRGVITVHHINIMV